MPEEENDRESQINFDQPRMVSLKNFNFKPEEKDKLKAPTKFSTTRPT